MNLYEIMKDYVESMLSEQPGRKALILDRQTLGKFNHNTKCKLTLLTLFFFPSHRLHDLQPDLNPVERSILYRCH